MNKDKIPARIFNHSSTAKIYLKKKKKKTLREECVSVYVYNFIFSKLHRAQTGSYTYKYKINNLFWHNTFTGAIHLAWYSPGMGKKMQNYEMM